MELKRTIKFEVTITIDIKIKTSETWEFVNHALHGDTEIAIIIYIMHNTHRKIVKSYMNG